MNKYFRKCNLNCKRTEGVWGLKTLNSLFHIFD